ncbi:PREDICTED: IST1 homolog isoform X2 [Dufourea novaeangliae]|uniref:IST1 homolog isoform X2 n=1 Tax=Dufourea novaeangliae TaxID=178035 RepID=UPI00076705D5|nr:PREDICTED: IST1 homolog isoform X2 [Dufourea novaeangliae]
MFSSGPNYTKLKTHLRLAINRLKLLEKKKTELAQKARKEIADYIAAGKVERAKIRVEHIIREDYMVEAMELLEMYCDLLLARFGLIQQMKNLDEGLAEAISTIIWAAPRIQTDVQEIKVIADILTSKYGKQYTDACREEAVHTISEKLKHKMSVQSPSKLLVEKYLVEIAKNYNVEYEPDPQIMAEGQDALLIDVGGNGETRNNLDAASGGGIPQPVGFIGFPQPPLLPDPATNFINLLSIYFIRTQKKLLWDLYHQQGLQKVKLKMFLIILLFLTTFLWITPMVINRKMIYLHHMLHFHLI